jgi:outer membrane protein assembly factor BamB
MQATNKMWSGRGRSTYGYFSRLFALAVLLTASASCAATAPEENGRTVGTILWQNPTIRADNAAGFDGSSVFVIDTARRLHVLSRADGSIRWSLPLTATAFPQRIDAAGGIILIAAGSLIAVDTQTRTERWRVNTPERLGNLAFALEGTTVYPSVFFGAGDAVALDLFTGSERWRVNIMPRDSVIGGTGNVRTLAPAVHNGLVAFPFRFTRAANDRGTTGVAVVDAVTGQLRWTRVLPITGPITTAWSMDRSVGPDRKRSGWAQISRARPMSDRCS